MESEISCDILGSPESVCDGLKSAFKGQFTIEIAKAVGLKLAMDQNSLQIYKSLLHMQPQPLQKQHLGLCWYSRCFQSVRLWAFALPEAGSRTGLWILILHFRTTKGFCMLMHCQDRSPCPFCNEHDKNVHSHFSLTSSSPSPITTHSILPFLGSLHESDPYLSDTLV